MYMMSALRAITITDLCNQCFIDIKATMFNLSVLDQKKIQNLMREYGKKTFKKKTTLSLFVEKLMRATIKKHWTNFSKS